MHLLGEIIAYLFVLAWIPFCCYTLGHALGTLILPEAEETPIEHTPKKKVVKPTPSKKVVVKGSYPVHGSFREEHRITNPVQFDD